MKRLYFALVVFVCASVAFGATPRSSATSQPTARVSRTSASAPGTPVSVARGVSQRSTGQPTNENVQPRSATARSAVSQPTTVGRAAKQSVISTGTKVAAATENTAVDQVCWGKFSGCMDSFCMLDNANGGRCICSDKNAEYDAILEEIQKLDEQSYQLATVGVERIEMGDAVDAVMSKTDSVTKRVTADAAKSKRQSLDLSSWNSLDLDFDADAEDIFDFSSDGVSISNKTGDALYRAAAKLCNAQIPECKSQSTLMDLMYKQRVRSDCTAYENSLRQARTQSAQKLAAAQSAMREAALEQYRNANKYDLGQCTVQFKQCMQTTGGCGDDFSGCVGSIQEVTTGVQFDSLKQKKIKGNSSTITIAQSTYDILEAKKALCMTVTQECVNVRDQVWDAFIREAAPQVKAAELMAESDMRTSCISNISNCFQKACHDTMDPNDPEGSYDMCLTNPDMVSNLCKVQVTPCENSIPGIMEYVKARLKSMRVDSCTNEFKACLQSEDRCGEDYTQCIGLDTDTIVHMCPADKLVGCQDATHNADYVYLEQVAQGIFLNIDNNMLTACQRAADAAMIKVCGSTENCDDLVVDNGAGTRSFKYEICKYKKVRSGRGNNQTESLQEQYCRDSLDGFTKDEIKDTNNPLAGKLSGIVYWGEISYEEKTTRKTDGGVEIKEFQFTPIETYMNKVAQSMGLNSSNNLREEDKEVIRDRVYGMEVKALTSAVENAINAIESDPKVQYCMTGREFQGYKEILGSGSKSNPRFPNLTSQMRQTIAISALKNARDNYMKTYDEEMERMAKDQVKAAQMVDEEKAKLRAIELCRDLGNTGTLPASDAPKASNAGKWVLFGVTVVAATLITIFTWGAGAVPSWYAVAAMGAGLVGSAVIAEDAANNPVAEQQIGSTYTGNISDYIGTSTLDQWNYKEKIVTTPIYETGVCIKETTTQKCIKTEKNYCDEWDVEQTETKTINLLD